MRALAVIIAVVLGAACGHASTSGHSTKYPRSAALETLVPDDAYHEISPPPPVDVDLIGDLLVEDRCPDSFEVINGFQDLDGCADIVPAPLAEGLAGITYTIREGKSLDRGIPSRALSATIKRVADTLRAYPDTSIVVVVSSLRSESEHRDLSHRRAALLKALIEKEGGIDPERIEYAGLGPHDSLVINFLLLPPLSPSR